MGEVVVYHKNNYLVTKGIFGYKVYGPSIYGSGYVFRGWAYDNLRDAINKIPV